MHEDVVKLTKRYFKEISKEDEVILYDFLSSNLQDIKCEQVEEEELKCIQDIKSYVYARFTSMKYILGLAIDFILLADNLASLDEQLNEFDRELDEDKLFSRYKLVEKVGSRESNTLSLVYGENKKIGIRKFEEKVVQFFHQLNRVDYPSAYVYNTGQWQKFKDLLVMCFKLSSQGRLEALLTLISGGIELMSKTIFFTRRGDKRNLFLKILSEYPRSANGENGGLSFQAMIYGFFVADRNHLSIIADKVRTGSARQKRIGDIDCYNGIELEVSVEVKDMDLSSDNYQREVSGFVNNIESGNLFGIIACKTSSEDFLVHLQGKNVVVVTDNSIKQFVKTWDWPKQNKAVNGMLHFLSHIEQNTQSTQRLLNFIKESEYHHESLIYLD